MKRGMPWADQSAVGAIHRAYGLHDTLNISLKFIIGDERDKSAPTVGWSFFNRIYCFFCYMQ
jgi:hypothetical protein